MNNFTIKKLNKMIRSAGVDETNYQSVKREIAAGNRRVMVFFSVLISAILAVLFVVSFFAQGIAAYRLLYGGFLFPLALVHAIARRIGKDNYKGIQVLVYIFLALLMAIGIVLGTFLSPMEITATYIALLLTAPQMFTDRPCRLYLMVIATNVVFVITVLLVKDPITHSSDVTNALVFGILSMVLCTYSANNRVSRYYLEDTIRFLAESDQLTGMRNRNSYEQRINDLSEPAESVVFCVYVDINGLHELNNVKGHEAGDKMLQYVANVMQNIFGRDHSYRIGGDEYVVLDVDKNEAQVEDMVKRFKTEVEAAGYFAAIGYSCRNREEMPVRELIKDAEQKMNRDKRAFYTQEGRDRRRAR